MKKIFETHAHYDDPAFDLDRDELLNSFKSNGIEAVVNIGANLPTSEKTLELTQTYDFMYGAVGVHPSDIRQLEAPGAIERIEELAGISKKIVAIGEIGLDYHYDDADPDLQKKWFVKQMELARRLELPIIVHSRDAAQDTIDIMTSENAGDIGGVVHCYSYSKEVAKTFLDMGFYIGVGGVVTFKNGKKLKETVEYMPLDKIVLETDCPYLAPEPYRGKRNSSLYIPFVAETIAEIKGITVEQVYEATWNNAMKLYRI